MPPPPDLPVRPCATPDRRVDGLVGRTTEGARRRCALDATLEEGGRQIISIFDMTLAGMARAHSVAAVIEEAANQQTLGFGPFGLMVVDLVIQLGLNGRKEVLIENGRLLTFEDFALEGDFADIEAIAKQMRERAPRERYAADGVASLKRTDLGDDAALAQVGHQEVEAAELEIAAEDFPDPFRLSVIDRDPSTLGVIAERGHASDPEPLALGSRDLVADALGGDFALELGKRQQDVEGQPAHRGGGVELLGDRDKRHIMLVE